MPVFSLRAWKNLTTPGVPWRVALALGEVVTAAGRRAVAFR